MWKYVIRRVLLMIPILIGVVVVVFTINYFSGTSPAVSILGSYATPENVAELNAQLGLDRPYLVQIGEYIWNIFTHFDFGTSYIYNVPVWEQISQRFPITAAIGLIGVLLSVVIGVPLGVIAAVKQYSVFDYGSTLLAIIIAALPNFWVALMLILLFSVKLAWLPVAGLASWKGWILPVLSVGIGPIAMITRMTRSSMLEVIRQDYIRTARAKGLPEKKVIIHHALKNGMIPVATVIGMMIGISMTGTIIVETIFNISGMGLLMYQAISTGDTITVQGCAIVCAFVVTTMNLLTDIAYAFIDPRIKAQYTNSGRKKKIKKSEIKGGVAA